MKYIRYFFGILFLLFFLYLLNSPNLPKNEINNVTGSIENITTLFRDFTGTNHWPQYHFFRVEANKEIIYYILLSNGETYLSNTIGLYQYKNGSVEVFLDHQIEYYNMNKNLKIQENVTLFYDGDNIVFAIKKNDELYPNKNAIERKKDLNKSSNIFLLIFSLSLSIFLLFYSFIRNKWEIYRKRIKDHYSKKKDSQNLTQYEFLKNEISNKNELIFQPLKINQIKEFLTYLIINILIGAFFYIILTSNYYDNLIPKYILISLFFIFYIFSVISIVITLVSIFRKYPIIKLNRNNLIIIKNDKIKEIIPLKNLKEIQILTISNIEILTLIYMEKKEEKKLELNKRLNTSYEVIKKLIEYTQNK